MRAHHRPTFRAKSRRFSPIFQRGRVHSLFCGDRSRHRAQKTATFTSFRDIAPFSPDFTHLNHGAVSRCGMESSFGAFFCRLLHTITAAAHHRGGTSRDRALIATHPVCFDRLTPQAATTSYVIGSAILAKKQLFHVKHRFLQCFSLEFYLLFALSSLPYA